MKVFESARVWCRAESTDAKLDKLEESLLVVW